MKLKFTNIGRHLTPKNGVAFAAAFLIGSGVLWAALRSPAEESKGGAVADQTAAVVKIGREDLAKDITLAAEFRPYEEVELHAKVAGYVKAINVDIGDRVKEGQLLATLEVPELQDELRNAMAAAEKAAAAYTNAHLVYTRLEAVNKEHPNLVAQQDLDNASANDETASAADAAAEASVEKYRTLISYTRITAPFDGVITRRYADPGALIQAGTSSDTQARPLVRISNNYRLRLDFPVTVDYVKDIHQGDSIEVYVESLKKTLTGTIARSSGTVDDATRTMIAEVEMSNPDLQLVPGMYATASLKVERRPNALALPVEGLADEKNSTVLVVNAKHQVEERHVQLGLETSDKYEVLSGLSEGDLVLVGNHSLRPGQTVEPKLMQLSMASQP